MLSGSLVRRTDSKMFGRNDWNRNGSYGYSDRAMDMMSMRYVMTDGTWEDDEDTECVAHERDRFAELHDWDDDDDCDERDDDNYDERDYDDE